MPLRGRVARIMTGCLTPRGAELGPDGVLLFRGPAAARRRRGGGGGGGGGGAAAAWRFPSLQW